MSIAHFFRDERGLVLSEYLGLLGGIVVAGVAGVVVLSGGLGGVAGTSFGDAEDGRAGYFAKAGGPLLTPMPAVGLPPSGGSGSGTTGSGNAGGSSPTGGGSTGSDTGGSGTTGGNTAGSGTTGGNTGGSDTTGGNTGGSGGATPPVTYTLASMVKSGRGNNTVYTGTYEAAGQPSVIQPCGRNPCARTIQIP